jgi:integrase
MAKALTQVAIDNLKSGTARREIPDGKESGLYFVIQPTGRMAWALRYRFNGRPRKLTIGSYPSTSLAKARAEAARAKVSISDGIDAAATKRAATAAKKTEGRANDQVDKVVAAFINLYARPNTRDWRETERLLAEFAKAWKERLLREIGKPDIHRVLDAIVARGAPVTANRKFAQLRKMCRWAVSRGIIEHSPCDGIDPPSAEKSRDRVLDADEIRLVWRAADDLGFPFGPIVKLLVLTGQRRSEVGGMEWREIDLEKSIWTIPAQRSKNKRQHALPLSPQAIEIIERLPKFSGSRFVFSPGETAPSGFSRAKTRLDGFIAKLNGGGAIPPWILHDIRRSVASGLAALGINLPVIERCLNHVSGSFAGIVGVYQKHNFSDEMRAAMERWGRQVDTSVNGGPAGKIVELRHSAMERSS